MVRDALHRLDPLWEELFPAEQTRIVQALVERVTVGPAGADIRLRVEGLAGLGPGPAGEPGTGPAGGGVSQATSITVHVPLHIRRRGGRKVVIAPDGLVLPQASQSVVPPTADPVLVKALARAFRWKRMLDEGRYGSVRELADGEGVKPSYAAGIVRLTLLGPDLVEAILNGQPIRRLTLDLLLKSFPPSWSDQSGISHGIRWPKDDSTPIAA